MIIMHIYIYIYIYVCIYILCYRKLTNGFINKSENQNAQNQREPWKKWLSCCGEKNKQIRITIVENHPGKGVFPANFMIRLFSVIR